MYYERYHGKTIELQGYNAALATTNENLSEHSTLIDYAGVGAAAAKLQISSSSAADAAAGTGARTVTICGLDADYKPLLETIALNGQTQVETVNAFLRVFSVEVATVGSGRTNAGDLYIIMTGTGGTLVSGVPPTLTSLWVKVLVGTGVGTSGMITVPAGCLYEQLRLHASGMAQPVILSIWTYNAVEGTKQDQIYGIGTNQNLNRESERKIKFAEKTDIYLRALSTTAAGRATAILSLASV